MSHLPPFVSLKFFKLFRTFEYFVKTISRNMNSALYWVLEFNFTFHCGISYRTNSSNIGYNITENKGLSKLKSHNAIK